jgi:hypothetical protein
MSNLADFFPSDGGGMSWEIVSSATTAEASKGYLVNVSSSALTITLPASPSEGDSVGICDYKGNAVTNNITIARNSLNILGSAEDLVIDIDNGSVVLTYSDATEGWVITSSVGVSV